MDIFNLKLDKEKLMDFSQHFKIERPAFMGSRFFPDVKTQYLEAEYMKLSADGNIPSIALVHALDTEARLAERPNFQKASIEKLFFKEKINVSERLQMFFAGTAGTLPDSTIMDFVYNDGARLSEDVLTRTEVAKMEAFTTGKMTIRENDLTLDVDYGVPSDHRETVKWYGNPDADVIGYFQKVIDNLADKGVTPSNCVISQKIASYLRTNKGIQRAINGTLEEGILLTLPKVNALFSELFGFSFEVANNGVYKYQKADGTFTTKRFYDADTIVLYQAVNGSVGRALWGPTPEELSNASWDSKSLNQFITVTSWSQNDPVATWVKASGLMVPCIPNPELLYYVNVTDATAGE